MLGPYLSGQHQKHYSFASEFHVVSTNFNAKRLVIRVADLGHCHHSRVVAPLLWIVNMQPLTGDVGKVDSGVHGSTGVYSVVFLNEIFPDGAKFKTTADDLLHVKPFSVGGGP